MASRASGAGEAARGAASVSGDMRHAVGTNTRLGEGGGWSAALDAAEDASSYLKGKSSGLSASVDGTVLNSAKRSSYVGTGEYGDVGGHHVHAKAAFKDNPEYNPAKGFSIGQDFMEKNGIDHQAITSKQRELYKELYESGRPNTLDEHSRIAREALKAGGASDTMADILVKDSLDNLAFQKVFNSTRIPWYTN